MIYDMILICKSWLSLFSIKVFRPPARASFDDSNLSQLIQAPRVFGSIPSFIVQNRLSRSEAQAEAVH